MSSGTNGREHEVIIFGATGFTGQLIVDYFHQTFKGDRALNWAIAGRNPLLVKELSKKYSVPFFVADANNTASLVEMTSKTKVLLNVVGPFKFYSETVIRACFETSTDYVDLCGEADCLGYTDKLFGDQAIRKNIVLIQACGMDSCHVDLGFLFTEAFAANGAEVVEFAERIYTPLYSYWFADLVSQGMWDTVVETVARNAECQYAERGYGPRELPRSLLKLKENEHDGTFYMTPYSTTDPFIIGRTMYLEDRPKRLQFRQDVQWDSLLRLLACMFCIVICFIMTQLGQTSVNLLKVLKKQRDGPHNLHKIRLLYYSKLSNGKNIKTCLRSEKNNYEFSGVSSGEIAYVLAKQKDVLPTQNGLLTPAFALKNVAPLIRSRFEAAGVFFDIIN